MVGGALLVHGLTDAPYSMRAIGEDLRARGYRVLALRVPGHGTVPAGLTDVTWEDWLAAVRLAARIVLLSPMIGVPKFAWLARVTRTVISNVHTGTSDVAERSTAGGGALTVTRPLDLAWPRDVFSLSHVAVPFPMTDPVYGGEEVAGAPLMIRLGLISPRGERAVFSVPSDTLMRLTCNPFLPCMNTRIAGWVPAAPLP